MKMLTVLGSTGSIGTNTLDVVRRNLHRYGVYALVAGRNVDVLAAQIVEFRPQVAVVATSDGLARLSERLLAARVWRAPSGRNCCGAPRRASRSPPRRKWIR